MGENYNPFQGVYDETGFPEFKSQQIPFSLAPTTEDWFSKNPLTEDIEIPDSSHVLGRTKAENTAQAGIRQSNYLKDAHDSIMDLMKGGKAIPRSFVEPETGSGKTSGLDLTSYNRVERDIRGNIIGLSGKTQVDPISGASVGKIAPDWQAKQKGVSETGEVGPQESAISQENRSAFLKSKLQQGANVVAQIKAARSAAGFDPETGVWSPKDQGIPNTYETKNVDIKQTALNKTINQASNGKAYEANLYGKAYQGMPTKGKTIFGEHGYAQSYPASQSSTSSSRAFTKAFTESELKESKKQNTKPELKESKKQNTEPELKKSKKEKV